ncbi:hypothetical protein FB559_8347 [Actinoallomurus bryophytorum]|uniref:Uncharacterized protein n=1 Tax=Actinoallomurus bryophytorum TaxID=1490222 RepID=A0A543C1S7_9ACTN|nr:hypothetical protein FB559_8347 [Actinoallomurus bryophytorum]
MNGGLAPGDGHTWRRHTTVRRTVTGDATWPDRHGRRCIIGRARATLHGPHPGVRAPCRRPHGLDHATHGPALIAPAVTASALTSRRETTTPGAVTPRSDGPSRATLRGPHPGGTSGRADVPQARPCNSWPCAHSAWSYDLCTHDACAHGLCTHGACAHAMSRLKEAAGATTGGDHVSTPRHIIRRGPRRSGPQPRQGPSHSTRGHNPGGNHSPRPKTRTWRPSARRVARCDPHSGVRTAHGCPRQLTAHRTHGPLRSRRRRARRKRQARAGGTTSRHPDAGPWREPCQSTRRHDPGHYQPPSRAMPWTHRGAPTRTASQHPKTHPPAAVSPPRATLWTPSRSTYKGRVTATQHTTPGRPSAPPRATLWTPSRSTYTDRVTAPQHTTPRAASIRHAPPGGPHPGARTRTRVTAPQDPTPGRPSNPLRATRWTPSRSTYKDHVTATQHTTPAAVGPAVCFSWRGGGGRYGVLRWGGTGRWRHRCGGRAARWWSPRCPEGSLPR